MLQLKETVYLVRKKNNHFAHGTSLFFRRSKESFEVFAPTIHEYAKYFDLNINFDKAEVVWFGFEQPTSIKFLSTLTFSGF